MPPIQDTRADSTLDRTGDQQPADVLGAIAQEEIDADAALAAKIEKQVQDDAEAAFAALADDWSGAMRHAADIVTAAAPELKPVWNVDAMNRIGAALARCDLHYGWGGAAQLFGHPLVALGVASMPVVIGTAAYFKAKQAEARAAALAARNAIADARTGPMTKPGHPGAPVAPVPAGPHLGDVIDVSLARDTVQA
ncbi:hypothetical protein [Burkholderia sp. BCC1988]|uniref:hypothetical protein n=1 Tax=Burkholderia sp. BCC1988 TaxID=2817443 RepID=UPI002AB1AFFB|nr:hypothetical protein [Burkholderia sp. BCC1988]